MLAEPLNNLVVLLFFMDEKLSLVSQFPHRVKYSKLPPGVFVDVCNHES